MNNLDKEFVLYPEALALKELGFDEVCFAYYRDGRITGVNRWDRKDWEFHVISKKDITSSTNEIILAPTYSQTFRFFRDKFNCQHYIGKLPKMAIEAIKRADKYKGNYQWMITCDESNPPCPPGHSGVIEGYEEAELLCLQKLIEVVNKNILNK